jgi:hypothetical protein
MEVRIFTASFTFTLLIIKKMAEPLNDIEVCGHPFPVSFLQMLASTLMVNAAGEVLGFNIIVEDTDLCDCTPLVDCDNNHVPPETLLVRGFGVDECGHLAIKLVSCDGTSEREQ